MTAPDMDVRPMLGVGFVQVDEGLQNPGRIAVDMKFLGIEGHGIVRERSGELDEAQQRRATEISPGEIEDLVVKGDCGNFGTAKQRLEDIDGAGTAAQELDSTSEIFGRQARGEPVIDAAWMCRQIDRRHQGAAFRAKSLDPREEARRRRLKTFRQEHEAVPFKRLEQVSPRFRDAVDSCRLAGILLPPPLLRLPEKIDGQRRWVSRSHQGDVFQQASRRTEAAGGTRFFRGPSGFRPPGLVAMLAKPAAGPPQSGIQSDPGLEIEQGADLFVREAPLGSRARTALQMDHARA